MKRSLKWGRYPAAFMSPSKVWCLVIFAPIILAVIVPSLIDLLQQKFKFNIKLNIIALIGVSLVTFVTFLLIEVVAYNLGSQLSNPEDLKELNHHNKSDTFPLIEFAANYSNPVSAFFSIIGFLLGSLVDFIVSNNSNQRSEPTAPYNGLPPPYSEPPPAYNDAFQASSFISSSTPCTMRDAFLVIDR